MDVFDDLHTYCFVIYLLAQRLVRCITRALCQKKNIVGVCGTQLETASC
jgi:hypothetical protein